MGDGDRVIAREAIEREKRDREELIHLPSSLFLYLHFLYFTPFSSATLCPLSTVYTEYTVHL
jgi:hypothetical protein